MGGSGPNKVNYKCEHPLNSSLSLGLTKAPWHSATPVGCGGIAARQCGGTLELISIEAVEIGLSLRMEACDGHISVCWSIREVATQDKCCNGEQKNK